MNENRLRWRGRIGALRDTALGLGLMAALVLLYLALDALPSALRNPAEPQVVSIGQLARKEIGTGRYVTTSGTAVFDAGITESNENGQLVGFVYPLVDIDGMALIHVRSSQPEVDAAKVGAEQVTVTGMVRGMDASLQTIIDKNIPEIEGAGIAVASGISLAQGEKPASAGLMIVVTALLGLFILLCLATLPFSYPVFGKHPVEASPGPAAADGGVKVTGRLGRLKSFDPIVEPAKGTKKFREAQGNIVTLTDGRFMIYVRQVARYWGIVKLSTTHWALIPDTPNVAEVEPGKLYGWKDRPAVRMPYMDDKGKTQDLIVSFNHSSAQTEFLSFLQGRGFSTSSGI